MAQSPDGVRAYAASLPETEGDETSRMSFLQQQQLLSPVGTSVGGDQPLSAAYAAAAASAAATPPPAAAAAAAAAAAPAAPAGHSSPKPGSKRKSDDHMHPLGMAGTPNTPRTGSSPSETGTAKKSRQKEPQDARQEDFDQFAESRAQALATENKTHHLVCSVAHGLCKLFGDEKIREHGLLDAGDSVQGIEAEYNALQLLTSGQNAPSSSISNSTRFLFKCISKSFDLDLHIGTSPDAQLRAILSSPPFRTQEGVSEHSWIRDSVTAEKRLALAKLAIALNHESWHSQITDANICLTSTKVAGKDFVTKVHIWPDLHRLVHLSNDAPVCKRRDRHEHNKKPKRKPNTMSKCVSPFCHVHPGTPSTAGSSTPVGTPFKGASSAASASPAFTPFNGGFPAPPGSGETTPGLVPTTPSAPTGQWPGGHQDLPSSNGGMATGAHADTPTTRAGANPMDDSVSAGARSTAFAPSAAAASSAVLAPSAAAATTAAPVPSAAAASSAAAAASAGAAAFTLPPAEESGSETPSPTKARPESSLSSSAPLSSSQPPMPMVEDNDGNAPAAATPAAAKGDFGFAYVSFGAVPADLPEQVFEKLSMGHAEQTVRTFTNLLSGSGVVSNDPAVQERLASNPAFARLFWNTFLVSTQAAMAADDGPVFSEDRVEEVLASIRKTADDECHVINAYLGKVLQQPSMGGSVFTDRSALSATGGSHTARIDTRARVFDGAPTIVDTCSGPATPTGFVGLLFRLAEDAVDPDDLDADDVSLPDNVGVVLEGGRTLRESIEDFRSAVHQIEPSAGEQFSFSDMASMASLSDSAATVRTEVLEAGRITSQRKAFQPGPLPQPRLSQAHKPQRQVGERLADRIMDRLAGADGTSKFSAIGGILMLVPAINSLYEQTKNRLEQSNLLADLGLAGKVSVQDCIVKCNGTGDAAVQTFWSAAANASKTNPSLLFVILTDEAHWAVGKYDRDANNTSGMMDKFLNQGSGDLYNPLGYDRANVIRILVTATPYVLQTNVSRIPIANEVYWFEDQAGDGRAALEATAGGPAAAAAATAATAAAAAGVVAMDKSGDGTPAAEKQYLGLEQLCGSISEQDSTTAPRVVGEKEFDSLLKKRCAETKKTTKAGTVPAGVKNTQAVAVLVQFYEAAMLYWASEAAVALQAARGHQDAAETTKLRELQAQAQGMSSPATIKVVRGLLGLAGTEASDASKVPTGTMVVIRVPNKDLGRGLSNKLRKARGELGLTHKFAVFFDSSESKSLVEVLGEDRDFDPLRYLRLLCKSANASAPRTYEDLEGLPCIMVLCDKGRMGDTFPKSFAFYDLRLRFGTGGGVPIASRTFMEQDFGRMFRYGSSLNELPLCLLSQRAFKMLASFDSVSVYRIRPDLKVSWTSSSRPAPEEISFDNDSNFYRLYTRPNTDKANAHYDQGRSKRDKEDPMRFLLVGKPQIGKTGAYLHALKTLGERLKDQDCVLVSSVADPLSGFDEPDEEDGPAGLELVDGPSTERNLAPYPALNIMRKLRFKHKLFAGKYGDIDLAAASLGAQPEKSGTVAGGAHGSTSKSTSALTSAPVQTKVGPLDLLARPAAIGEESGADTFDIVDVDASWIEGPDCERSFSWVVPRGDKRPSWFQLDTRDDYGGQDSQETANPPWIKLPLIGDHNNSSQPGALLPIRTPIFMPTCGRASIGLLDLSQAMDGDSGDFVQIIVVKQSEYRRYQQHHPDRVLCVLPESLTEKGIGAARDFIKRLGEWNLRTNTEKRLIAEEKLWPFLLMLDDSCLRFLQTCLRTDECNLEPPTSEALMTPGTDLWNWNGGAGLLKHADDSKVRRPVPLSAVMRHIEQDAKVLKYALIGIDRWRGLNQAATRSAFLRRQVYSFVMLNLASTRNVHFNPVMRVWEDIDFNLRLDRSGGLICKYMRFAMVKKQMSEGGCNNMHRAANSSSLSDDDFTGSEVITLNVTGPVHEPDMRLDIQLICRNPDDPRVSRALCRKLAIMDHFARSNQRVISLQSEVMLLSPVGILEHSPLQCEVIENLWSWTAADATPTKAIWENLQRKFMEYQAVRFGAGVAKLLVATTDDLRLVPSSLYSWLRNRTGADVPIEQSAHSASQECALKVVSYEGDIGTLPETGTAKLEKEEAEQEEEPPEMVRFKLLPRDDGAGFELTWEGQKPGDAVVLSHVQTLTLERAVKKANSQAWDPASHFFLPKHTIGICELSPLFASHQLGWLEQALKYSDEQPGIAAVWTGRFYQIGDDPNRRAPLHIFFCVE